MLRDANVQLIPSGATAQVYINYAERRHDDDHDRSCGKQRRGHDRDHIRNYDSDIERRSHDTLHNTQASTMVYVDGTMTFQGPGEGQGAVQDNAMITLTASGDAIATGDVLYKTEPVTIPQIRLIPVRRKHEPGAWVFLRPTETSSHRTLKRTRISKWTEVLPRFRAHDSANNCASGKGGQLSNGHINTFNNVGGMIQSCIYAADVNTENTWFDRRFTSRPTFAPPWFPSTTITTGGALPSNPSIQLQRIQWVNTSSD